MSEALLEEYLEEILEANNRVNLTTITDVERARILHLEDSLSALPELEASLPGLLGDLGTGGGFPGVPLAIASGRETLLVDSAGKKIQAIQSVIDELQLQDLIHTYNGRIEELSRQEPESFSVVTARALSSLPSLLELASPLLPIGGRLICYKSRTVDEELELVQNSESILGMKFVSKREVVLSDTTLDRTIVVFEKTSAPSVSLPRKTGKAQKRPLLN